MAVTEPQEFSYWIYIADDDDPMIIGIFDKEKQNYSGKFANLYCQKWVSDKELFGQAYIQAMIKNKEMKILCVLPLAPKPVDDIYKLTMSTDKAFSLYSFLDNIKMISTIHTVNVEYIDEGGFTFSPGKSIDNGRKSLKDL